MESYAEVFISHSKTSDVLQDVITSNYTYIKIVCMMSMIHFEMKAKDFLAPESEKTFYCIHHSVTPHVCVCVCARACVHVLRDCNYKTLHSSFLLYYNIIFIAPT